MRLRASWVIVQPADAHLTYRVIRKMKHANADNNTWCSYWFIDDGCTYSCTYISAGT
jgi:hypothetical protein